MSIQGPWESQIEAIIDIRLGDADAYTWKSFIMDKLLNGWEKTKKEKNGKDCYGQQRKFSPFVLSVDGMTSKESLVVLATLSRLMAPRKWTNPFLGVTEWVNGLIEIAFTRW